MNKYFDFSSFIIILLKRWKLLLVHFVIACIIAIIYSFFIAKKQYSSSIIFLPPTQEEQSLANLLPGAAFGGLSSSDLMPQQFVTIFNSKILRRQIFEKFDYYKKFKLETNVNKFEAAIKAFKKDLILEIDELGSLGVTQHISYKMTCFHSSPDTSLMVVQFAFSFLDSTIREISMNKGKSTRKFVESQLALNKIILDSIQNRFIKFQKENKVFEVKGQVQLSLEAYGELKAQYVTNDIKIQSLSREYGNNHPLIAELVKANSIIKSKIRDMELKKSPDVIMGLEKSTEVMPVYTNLMRDLEVQNKIIILLTQQLEEAKLKEAKDISKLLVIDPPYLPKYKIRPKRALLAIEIVSVYLFFTVFIMIFSIFYTSFIKKTSLYAEIINSFKK